jgi:choline/ethanolamine kinase
MEAEAVAALMARLSAVLGPRCGPVEPLPGALTARSFKARFGDHEYAVHVPGEEAGVLGLDPRSEQLAGVKAAELGIGPTVVATLDRPTCFVTELLPGKPVDPAELRSPEGLAEVVRLVRAFHESDVDLPRRIDPFAVGEHYGAEAAARGVALPDDYEEALRRARAIVEKLGGHRDHVVVPSHADLRPPLFFRPDGRLLLTGWRYAGMADRFFDLGNLAAGFELDNDGEFEVLEDYFGEPPSERRCAALKLMRFVSELAEATWGLLEAGVSRSEYDFEAYGREHFRRLGELADDEELAALLGRAKRRRRT